MDYFQNQLSPFSIDSSRWLGHVKCFGDHYGYHTVRDRHRTENTYQGEKQGQSWHILIKLRVMLQI